jgi:hypothetical protein
MVGKSDGAFLVRTLDGDGEYGLCLKFKGRDTNHRMAMIDGIVTINQKTFGTPKTIADVCD